MAALPDEGSLAPSSAPTPVATGEPGLAGTALDDIFPAVYEELRRVAHRHLRSEHTGHTLGTTALVHEA